MEDSQYFVQIKDPLDMRRDILGSSRQMIQILQRYERIKQLRIKKVEKIHDLKATTKEIHLLVTKMKAVLPAYKVRLDLEKENKPKRRGMTGDELKNLEAELRMIEEKIGNLS
ncbi:MAG: hypothetical protein V1729_02805 [Candidatus Woesearchaeota archaeon]